MPLPSRSVTWMAARSSTAGNAASRCAVPQLLPDWLKYSVTPSLRQVDEVGGARAVDVGEPDAALVELVGPVEPRRAVHRRPWRRSGRSRGSASSRPRRCGCGPGRSARRRTCRRGRWTAWRRRRPAAGRSPRRAAGGTLRRSAEAVLRQRRVPGEGVVLGDQDVGVAVAGQVDEAQVRIARCRGSAARETAGTDCQPSALVVLVEARRGAVEHHEVELAVAGEVQELRPVGARVAFGLLSTSSTAASRTAPLLTGLSCACSTSASACSVSMPGTPSPSRSTHWYAVPSMPLGRFSRLAASTSCDRCLDDRRGVVELQRRQSPLARTRRRRAGSRLRHGADERMDRAARIGPVGLVGVGQVDRADEAVGADTGLVLGKWWNISTRRQRRVVRTSKPAR